MSSVSQKITNLEQLICQRDIVATFAPPQLYTEHGGLHIFENQHHVLLHFQNVEFILEGSCYL